MTDKPDQIGDIGRAAAAFREESPRRLRAA